MSFRENVCGGGVAGLAAVLTTHPLDLLQVRLQSSRDLKNVQIVRKSGFGSRGVNGLRGIVLYEGWKGLFRGLVPSLASYVPSRAIFFGFYGFTRKHLMRRKVFSENNPMNALIPSAVGIMATSAILNPVFLLKTRIQVQEDFIKGNSKGKKGSVHYNGYVDAAKQIYRKEGFGAFYRGITASWLGISETALYFMIYEHMKSYLGINKKLKKGEPFPAHMIVGVTIACKLIAHAAAYPHEVLRTRMRETVSKSNPRLIELTKKIYRQEGIGAFYNGMGVHLFRVIPNAIVVFLVYEFVRSRFFNSSE